MHLRHRTYRVTVEAAQIDLALANAEKALDSGEGLGGTGFWKAVKAVKKDPDLTESYAARIATIDQAAFEQWAWFRVGFRVGTSLMAAGTLAGLVLIAWAYYLDGLTAVAVFYVGVGALLTTTHGLGHLIVGTAVGIRFTGWFIGKPSQPQPGVKVDYDSYLRAPARSRAWMHASGALATKVMPFALAPAALAADLPGWSAWVLVIGGLGMIVTDIAWSTKSSDWKKYRREMGYAKTN